MSDRLFATLTLIFESVSGHSSLLLSDSLKMFFVLFVIRWLIYTKLQESDLEYNSIRFCKLVLYTLIIWILHINFAS